MSKRVWITLGLLVSALLTSQAQSLDMNAVFSRANQFYLDGKYKDAREEYLKIVTSGHESAEVYYNLGNSCYKLGQIPSAILFYEKARLMNPKDEDIRFNLEMANQLIVDKINPVTEFFIKRWLSDISSIFKTEVWAWFSLIFFILILGAAGLIYGFRGSVLKKTLISAAILFLVMSITTFLFAQNSFNTLNKTPSAIVFSPSITAKSSPDMGGTDLFVIHEGIKVRITDRVGTWIRIRLADGNQAWIPKEAVIEI